MRPRACLLLFGFILLGLFLSGCPKRVVKAPPLEAPPTKNPVAVLLEAFSAAETLQSNASIRIETIRKGETTNIRVNGYVLYEKPGKLRILGYHPLGMSLFDALYVDGEFYVLNILQMKAYTGRLSEFEDIIEKAGLRISTEKTGESLVPTRVQIALDARKTRMDLRLKDVVLNASLPEGAFEWDVPKGVEVRPLSRFFKGSVSPEEDVPFPFLK